MNLTYERKLYMGRKKKPITGYGEGTIFFSNTQNKWMGQINIGRGDDGKMKRKTVYGKTADEVKSKLQQVRYDIFTRDFVHPSNITFEQLEKQILDDKLAMNEIQEQTYHRHMETLKRMASINKIPLQKINYSMLKHLMLSLVDDYADSTTKTKTGIRQVPINEAVKPIITQILNEYVPTEDGMLFHTSTGTLVASNTTNTEFQKIMKKYNIKDNNLKGDLSQHSLRHTYATRCIEGNMPPKVLQILLGHADIRITLDTYSNVFESFQAENVAKVDNYLSDLGIAI